MMPSLHWWLRHVEIVMRRESKAYGIFRFAHVLVGPSNLYIAGSRNCSVLTDSACKHVFPCYILLLFGFCMGLNK